MAKKHSSGQGKLEDVEKMKNMISSTVIDYRKNHRNKSVAAMAKEWSCSTIALNSVEKCISFAKLQFIAMIANKCEKLAYTVIENKRYSLEIDIRDIELICKLSEKQKIEIIIRALCERYRIYSLYNIDIINMIFDENKKDSYEIVGYMLKLFRCIRGISVEEFADYLNYDPKSVRNSETGNSALAAENVCLYSNYLNVPLDVLLIGQLESKEFAINYLMTELFRNTNINEKQFLRKFISVIRDRV